MSTYDLVTIGNYTKDTIVSAAGTRHVDGGGDVAGHVQRRAAHIEEPIDAEDQAAGEQLVEGGDAAGVLAHLCILRRGQ